MLGDRSLLELSISATEEQQSALRSARPRSAAVWPPRRFNLVVDILGLGEPAQLRRGVSTNGSDPPGAPKPTCAEPHGVG